MLREPVRSLMDPAKLLLVSPATSAAELAALMAERGVGAAMVVEDGCLVGIATERDLVFRVLAAGRRPEATPLSEIMTPSPVTIEPTASFGKALITMHKVGCRHLPVVVDQRPVGIVSARSALDPDLEELSVETHRRKAFEFA